MTYLHKQFQPHTYIQTKVKRAETENFFKRDNSVINHQTTTKFKLDLHNPMTYPYIKFELNVCNPYRDNERKLKFLIFLFKRDNSFKNQWTITKFEHDLCIPMTNLHMQFQSYTYMYIVREWKLKFSIFSKFKRDNSVKNKRTITKYNLDLPITNLHMQFEFYTCI